MLPFDVVSGRSGAVELETLKQAEYNLSLFGDTQNGQFCVYEVPGQAGANQT